MEYYIFCLSLLFLAIAGVVLICRKSPSEKHQRFLGHADEKALMSQQTSVPGKSPALYVGDPSNDVLKIQKLDLTFGPPEHPVVPCHLTLDLRGKITEDIGQNPQLGVSVYLNGQLGPTFQQKLCTDGQIEISQDGALLPDGEPPSKGNVVIRYSTPVPYRDLKKGYYTVRVEAYASEEVGKARMTGFEGAVWVDGKGDGCGGWV